MKRVTLGTAFVLAILLLAMGLVPTSPTMALGPSEQAAPFTPTLQRFADGFFQPVYLTHAGDGSGRLFVVEKGGKIKILLNGQVLQTPFLDVGSLINFGYEEGLISMVFHPGYANPASPGYRRFFIYYTYYTQAEGIVETLVGYEVSTSDPNRADSSTAQTLLTIPRPATIHGGGMLAFGPDGYLYLTTGDGNFQGDPTSNAQNKNLLLGKVLRLDVDSASPYAVPPTNPFVGQDNVREEIWAYGLRNPWRGSFDRQTGDLWIGDVGWGRWEEVNLQRAGSAGGQNYGWNIMEGPECSSEGCDQTGLTLPVTAYTHILGCAVIGGYVYRGSAMPALQGTYLFGDYCTGRIWSLREDAGGSWVRTQLLSWWYDIASFGEDEAGELYVIDSFRGFIDRLVDPSGPTPTPTRTPTPGGPSPTPTATATPIVTPTPGSGPGPDLIITAFAADPAPSNQSIPVSVTVLNQGNVSTGYGFDAHIFPDLGRPPVPSDINLVAHVSFPPLGPGASMTVTGSIYADSLEPGTQTLWALADGHDEIVETNEGNNTTSITATVEPPVAPSPDVETITFDDLAGQNQPLNGQYPAGVIDWATGQWYHSGPTGALATKSVRFNAWWATNVTFTFLTPRRLLSLQAYNGGTADTTIILSCANQPSRQIVLGAGQRGTIETGWTGTCGRVTIRNSNGPATLFDNLALLSLTAGSPTPTPSPTATPTLTATPTSTPIAGATDTPTPLPTATSTPTSVPPVAGERLVNPGFEDGLTGWELPSWFAGVATVQTEVVHSGAAALRFQGKMSGPHILQDVTATAGQTVNLTGWGKAAYNSGHAHVKLVAINNSKGVIATYPDREGLILPQGDWTQFSVNQVLPPGTVWARLLIDFSVLDGTVYLDDFSLITGAGSPTPTLSPTGTPTPTATPIPGEPTATPTPTPTEGPPVVEMLVNPGFEEGLTGWVRPSWFASVADVQTEVVHSGTRAFYFHGKTTGSYVSQDVTAAAGQSVTFSGWVKAAYNGSGGDWHNFGHAHIKLIALNSNKGKIHTYPGYDGLPIPPGDWTQVSFTEVLPPATAYVRLQFDTYGLDGTVYLDDLSLTASGP